MGKKQQFTENEVARLRRLIRESRDGVTDPNSYIFATEKPLTYSELKTLREMFKSRAAYLANATTRRLEARQARLKQAAEMEDRIRKSVAEAIAEALKPTVTIGTLNTGVSHERLDAVLPVQHPKADKPIPTQRLLEQAATAIRVNQRTAHNSASCGVCKKLLTQLDERAASLKADE